MRPGRDRSGRGFRRPRTRSARAHRVWCDASEREASTGNRVGSLLVRQREALYPLWPSGVILADPRFINPDGSVSMKFMWWGFRVPHKKLTIGGQRLDGRSRPLRASVHWGQPDGYRGSFWASGLTFPRAGCWQVTGRVGKVRLTFVTLVRKVPR